MRGDVWLATLVFDEDSRKKGKKRCFGVVFNNDPLPQGKDIRIAGCIGFDVTFTLVEIFMLPVLELTQEQLVVWKLIKAYAHLALEDGEVREDRKETYRSTFL
jgi:hypothetical protein